MSGWDLDSGNGAKVEFTKFPAGITRIRVIDDEPYVRWSHFLPKHMRSINCPGKGCSICDIRHQEKANKMPYTYAMSRRFALNVLNRETGKCEIMEQGVGFFQDLKDLMGDLIAQGKSLHDVDIAVKRRGTTKDDTKYRLDLGEEYVLSNEDASLAVTKTDLVDFFKPHTSEQILRIVQGEAWDEVFVKQDAVDDNVNNTDEDIEIS